MNFTQIKNLLKVKRQKRNNYFNSSETISILNGLALQIKTVNFFEVDYQFIKFLRFLKAFVRSKPEDSTALKKFNQVCQEIQCRIIQQSTFNKNQIDIVMEYLQLWNVMLKPNHRYLFDKNEMAINAEDLKKISSTLTERAKPITSDILSHFRKTLKRCFHSINFLNDYPALLRIILNLAKNIERKNSDAGLELAAMKLFEVLGSLAGTLKAAANKQIALYRLPQAIKKVNRTRIELYALFKPFINKDRLNSIVYELFLRQSYKDDASADLPQLCNSQKYAKQCKSDYSRFTKKYSCLDGNSSFVINIEYNNAPEMELVKACLAMREGESFIDWMQEMGFSPRYAASQYLLRIAESESDLFINAFLFERDEIDQRPSHSVLALYFPKKTNLPYLRGRAYSYSTIPSVLVHEYIHHLYSLFLDIKLDLTSTEGIAELFSSGICYSRNFPELKRNVNDTFIFEFLKKRKYPFYFNAFKWIAYLVNQQPFFYKNILNFLREGKKDEFNAELDQFIYYFTNIKNYLAWTKLQVETCDEYIKKYPDNSENKKPIIYLKDIIKQLETEQGTFFHNREFLASEVPPNLLTAKSRTARIQTKLAKSLMFEINEKDIDLFLLHNSRHPLSDEKGLIPYKPQSTAIMEIIIPLPLTALLTGSLSASLDRFGKSYKKKHPCLPRFINYGLKPVFFSLLTAGVNSLTLGPIQGLETKTNSFFSYLVLNYFGLVIGQPINQILVKKIHNKCISFLIQSLTWMFLWNPGLFTSEEFALCVVPMLLMQLINGMVFKTAELLTHSTINCINSKISQKNNQFNFFDSASNKNTQAFVPDKTTHPMSNSFFPSGSNR